MTPAGTRSTDTPPPARSLRLRWRFWRRSLSSRLLLVFVASATGLWLLLVAAVAIDGLRSGELWASRNLKDYARQVMVVARVLADRPTELARAVAGVQAIETEGHAELGERQPETRIQVWRGGELLTEKSALPSTPPSGPDRFLEFVHEGATWWSWHLSDPALALVVRVAVRWPRYFSLAWPSVGISLMPLVVSLPLLLIPAWIMTRTGLRPLRELGEVITRRRLEGSLAALPLTDLSELKPVVDAINGLFDRLDAQRQREREFVSDAAHELKTPIAIVQANAEMLRAAPDAADRKRTLADLLAGVERARRQIEQLLRLTRLEADAPFESVRSIDLAEFVRERIALLLPLADRRGITLDVRSPARCDMRLDVDAIGAVVDNLVDNAIKYSPAGSTVTTSLTRAGALGGPTLVVRDHGPGISPAARETAFRRFARLHDDADGASAGLGLSIVARATARLGARLALDDAHPGLRIELDLPPRAP